MSTGRVPGQAIEAEVDGACARGTMWNWSKEEACDRT